MPGELWGDLVVVSSAGHEEVVWSRQSVDPCVSAYASLNFKAENKQTRCGRMQCVTASLTRYGDEENCLTVNIVRLSGGEKLQF